MDREEAIEIIRKNMPSDKSLPVYEALQTLVPELAESEDERARKWLLDYAIEMIAGLESDISLSNYDGIKGHDPEAEAELAQWQKARAYLEKQKEPHYTKRNALFDKCVENCDPEVMKKVSDEVDEMLEKEQKLAEHSAKGRRGRIGGIPECVRRKAEAFRNKMEPPYDADDICTAYEAGALESAKPAEWSEEDENMLWNIISIVGQSKSIQADEMLDWLKSLRPQPKKELSIEKAIQWLDDTFYFLDNSSGRGPDYEITTHDFDSLEEMYDSFRKAVTVDSQPSWKPSEEQMEAVKHAYNSFPNDCPIKSNLRLLYHDLEKLGVREEPEYYQHFDPDC